MINTPTKQEIKDFYQKLHDRITGEYYVEHKLTQVQFQQQHDQCWRDYDNEMLLNGYMVKQYSYWFGKLLEDPLVESRDIEIVIISSTPLTDAQLAKYKGLLNLGEWELRETTESLVEV